MDNQRVKHISECFIKPQSLPEDWNHPFHLNPGDLAMLSVHYIQKGLLFKKPSNHSISMETLIECLKKSLSLALSHFYPLAGRFKTLVERQNPPSRVVYVDCLDSPGARFIVATLDSTVEDILSRNYVPEVVRSFFDHHKAINHDGHELSLLSVQVTELSDGVFIGTSMNHCLADGVSYWNFLKSWSEIFMAAESSSTIGSSILTRPPILKRRFPEGYGPTIGLPFGRPEDFTSHFEAPELRERIFHFSAESIKSLKAKANSDNHQSKTPGDISSFQSLSALVWRCVTRAQNLPQNRNTACQLAASTRTKTVPAIPDSYFGNAIMAVKAMAEAGELLGKGLGFAAAALHESVAGLDQAAAAEFLEGWLRSPVAYQFGRFSGSEDVFVGSSPRFDMYGSEFGDIYVLCPFESFISIKELEFT